MTESVRKRATYDDVLAAPANTVAELVAGELSVLPRPRRSHLRSATGLGAFLFGAFQIGAGGPGGWTILAEPELHVGPDPDVLVPDRAGWRSGRLVDDELDEPFITVVPDWVCEILSSGTRRFDRMKKMPVYARERVGHVWLVDPQEKIVEVFRLGGAGAYTLVGALDGEKGLLAEPFDATTIPPEYLWGKSA